MSGTIHFEYDREHDVVIATPHWKLATEADLKTWLGQWAAYLTPFGRKMDTIVVLDHFEVTPAIGSKWGEYRARLHRDHFNISIRVNANRDVKLFANTSSVRFNLSTQQAATVEDALAGLLELRRQAKLG